MYRVNLIVADPDSEYLDRVQDFIAYAFSAFFEVMTFSQGQLLRQYLAEEGHKSDVLVVHPDLLRDLADSDQLVSKVRLVLLLADGSLREELPGFRQIDKFQPGDRFIKEILSIYAENNSQVSMVVRGDSRTRLVAVYSPAGGTGKTSVALGLAARLSQMGRRVFCLSLESVNSLAPALACVGNDAMTHVLLSLNENSASLTMNLQLYKSTDPRLGVDFFEPPDCFLELGELDREDVRDLLVHLVKLGIYDEVVVDMDSQLDEKTLCILECADNIILVEGPEYHSRIKTDIFLEEINRIGLSDRLGLSDKLTYLVNSRQEGLEPYAPRSCAGGSFRIPFCTELWKEKDGRVIFDEQGVFIHAVSGLTKQLIKGQGDG